MKKLGIGCGGFVALIFLIGLGILVNIQINQPVESDYGTVSLGESLSPNPEKGLSLPGGNQPQKPVRLIVDASLADLRVAPGSEQGKIQVNGNYDKANFELTTDIKEKKDHYEYRIQFKNKRSLLGMMWASRDGGMGIDNKVRISLPPDLLYDFRLRADKGDYRIDLSGLAVRSMEINASMGQLDVLMREANQVAMEKMEVKGSMGEATVNDLQNYGFKKGRVVWSMGEASVRNSGPLREDMELHLKMSMGEANINVPENAVVDSSVGVFLGETRSPGKERPDYDGETANIRISGGTTMGEFSVTRGASRPSRSEIVKAAIQKQGVEAYIAELRELKLTDPENKRIGKNSLNSAGYLLLKEDMIAEAIEIFKLNVEFNPEYANGYDSLAEAYSNADLHELAFVNYQKALELNPSNNRARRYIARYKSEIN